MSNAAQNEFGSVVSLWRYPVKSMMGEELNATEVTERGLLGDRAYALVDSSDGKAATHADRDSFSCGWSFLLAISFGSGTRTIMATANGARWFRFHRHRRRRVGTAFCRAPFHSVEAACRHREHRGCGRVKVGDSLTAINDQVVVVSITPGVTDAPARAKVARCAADERASARARRPCRARHAPARTVAKPRLI